MNIRVGGTHDTAETQIVDAAGDAANARDTVHAELWEDHLERA